jgi:tRNA U34 5-methylaminomethyl-2-thiouridine-forming methyltransferase MnmC
MPASQESTQFEIVTVQSGARSLRSREFGETFHPVIGPMAEAVALHVRQQRLLERAAQACGPFVIWDVGLGAAANAVAVLEAFAGCPATQIELHSFDRTTAPLVFALQHAKALEYPAPHAAAIEHLLTKGEWHTPSLRWHFHAGDFRTLMGAASAPHAILYDPYSPAANPELWTLEQFTALHSFLDPARPCLLTNYTRSTAVRVTLLLAGFFVGLGHATGEKDQTTIAANALELLDEPLDLRWLERVRRSTRSAPLRAQGKPGPISPHDFALLAAHPLFSRLGA